MTSVQAYAENREYLQDRMTLLRLKLAREVAAVKARRGNRGEAPDIALPVPEQDGEDEADSLARVVQWRVAATPSPLPAWRLAEKFGLPESAQELLVLLLVAGLDERFGRVFAYLHEDASERRLTAGLAWRLLGLDALSPEAHGLLAPGSPLLTHELVRLPPPEAALPLASRPLALDARIAAFLLDVDAVDERIEDCVAVERCAGAVSLDAFEDGTRARLRNLGGLWASDLTAALWLDGPRGAGKTTAARHLARELGRELLLVDGQALAQAPVGLRSAWRAVQREQCLRDALVYVRDAGALDAAAREWLLGRLCPGIVFGSEDAPPTPSDVLVLELAAPGHGLRRAWWSRQISEAVPTEDEGGLAEELASRFRLTPGQIEAAGTAARRLAGMRAGPDAAPEPEDYFEAARAQSTTNLGATADKVTATYGWHDLVLPQAVMSRLKAIVSQVRNAATVYESWGFGAGASTGKGLAALFSGPSGTGKTMSAGVIARALGLDMYKIDLARVVSKYIGETEKNLDRVFGEAANANAVLFFDEADALFGKRSEVKDAHDRYANIEISYLLQKMEEYDGLAILATNFGQNLDEAFNRRLQFIIEFPLPKPEDRERIWRNHMPPAAPVAPGIDYGFLAGQFELTGGSIRNCVRSAAFAAAEDGMPIGMEHLVRAVAEELSKLGRPLQRADFGDYYGGVTVARRGRPGAAANGNGAG